MMEFYFLRYLLQHEKKNQNLSKLDININFYYNNTIFITSIENIKIL